MRKFVLGFIIGMLIMVPITALGQTSFERISAYVNPEIKVAVDGEVLNLDFDPIVYDQRTYLPVRELVEKIMGYDVDWIQETTTVDISNPNIWPLNDVSEVIKVGDTVIDFSDYGYNEFYNIDSSLDIHDIAQLIQRLEGRIEQHEQIIEASKNPKSGYASRPDIVEIFRDELDKLFDALNKWNAMLDGKMQEAESTKD